MKKVVGYYMNISVQNTFDECQEEMYNIISGINRKEAGSILCKMIIEVNHKILETKK